MKKVVYNGGRAIKVERKRNPTPTVDWAVLIEAEEKIKAARRERVERAWRQLRIEERTKRV